MIRIKKRIVDELVTDARNRLPQEACGYLAGTGNRVEKLLPLANADESGEHFSFNPRDQFAALKSARGEGLDLVAVYHSHPRSPARMSDEDRRLANDTNMIYVIYSFLTAEIRAFTIGESKAVSEVGVEVTE